MLALTAWLAQVVPDVAPAADSAWQQFGPFAICAVLAAGIVGWLLRDRSTIKRDHATEVATLKAEHAAALAAARKVYDDDVAAHRRQLDAEREANRLSNERLVASAERTAPILERAARALELAGAQR